MSSEIVMPRMGLTMESGIIVQWLKQEGEAVAAGEPVLEIETDKATVEIEALESGTLHKIVARAGEEIPVGGVIAYLLKPGETAAQEARQRIVRGSGECDGSGRRVPQHNGQLSYRMGGGFAQARRRAGWRSDLGVDLAQTQGSGPARTGRCLERRGSGRGEVQGATGGRTAERAACRRWRSA